MPQANVAAGRAPPPHGTTPAKVPDVTLEFWIVKIIATTLGETGGDTLSMQFYLGYLVSSLIFIVIFAVSVFAQIRGRAFHAPLYWFVIVATTMAGTTVADFADRSLGIRYAGGSTLLLALLVASLALWWRTTGSIDVSTVTPPRTEVFYWLSILLSQTLGTALGDWMADSNALGYEGGALVFGAALAVTAALYGLTSLSHTVLFWAAFILTRPLGATLGDILDKPVEDGGLAFSRLVATLFLAAVMVLLVLVFQQTAGRHPGGPRGSAGAARP